MALFAGGMAVEIGLQRYGDVFDVAGLRGRRGRQQQGERNGVEAHFHGGISRSAGDGPVITRERGSGRGAASDPP